MPDTRFKKNDSPGKVMRTPRSLDIDITNRCNLRCRYCYHFSSAGDVDGDLPKEEWIKFFKELNRLAVMNITLAGGEPFCREDLPEIIESIVKNKMRFSLLSNGTLITDEIAAFLSSTGRCNYIQVSIDGSNPEIHDTFRGRGSFIKAIDGIRTLKAHNINVAVRVTVHRHNVSDLENIAELLLEKTGLSGFSTNAASHMGLCRYNDDEVGLTVEDRMLAMESLLRLNHKYANRISANAGPLSEGIMWVKMEKARQNGEKRFHNRGYLTACGCVRNKVAVRADGVIVPCVMLSHIEVGRINKDSLEKIWQSHPEFQKMRSRRNIPLKNFAFCRKCPYMNYCTGNCPGLAYTITGKVNHPSPDACLRRFLEDGGKLPEPD